MRVMRVQVQDLLLEFIGEGYEGAGSGPAS